MLEKDKILEAISKRVPDRYENFLVRIWREIDDFISLSKISTLVNDAKLIKDENRYKIVGDPPEGAVP